MTEQIELSLTIDNIYENGDEITTERVVVIDPPPFPLIPDYDSSDDDYCDWEQEFILPATGANNPEGGDAGYFVKVTASSHPSLVPIDTEFEFV